VSMTATAVTGHVGGRLDMTERLRTLLDPGFLAEIGWDETDLVLRPPANHRQLGRPICRAEGCGKTAHGASRICRGCTKALARHGLTDADIAVLPPRQRSGPGRCIVPGCPRVWKSAPRQLCTAHEHQRAKTLKLTLTEFLTHPAVTPLPPCGPCAAGACTRDSRSGKGPYCYAHEQRFRAAQLADPSIDELAWRAIVPAASEPGRVSLRGLPPLVITQVLFGLQQRTRSGRKTNDDQIRLICNTLRRQRLTDLADFDGAKTYAYIRHMVNAMIGHVHRAGLDPETERVRDVWELAAFGHGGTLTFTGISQPWLRESAKRWAIDDLPRRRGHRVEGVVRHHISCLSKLSQSLRMRPDRGDDPAALGRADIENFLNRLAYQHANGQISIDARIRSVSQLKTIFGRIRAQGLTRPGGPAAGLGDDFVLLRGDIPPTPEREPGRDLPPEIMRQLCKQLPALNDVASQEVRIAVELLIDTGRRPEEICDLAWDCLSQDEDNKPVLVYNNDKENRLARRLPIADATAALIVAQKRRVRDRYPHTPLGELKLLPSRMYNPDGLRGISVANLDGRHRLWLKSLPTLRRADGTEFNTAAVVPYCYRHTYAQRHADAGVPVDVLQRLMDHASLDATKRYYRVGEKRRREAVDRLAALQFDRHGNRVWRQAKALLDSEHARRAVGEVVVPFGVCAEPSNVKAGGHACPYRFRCVGCDHFRTDASYLPDLQAHLDDLLRNRERLRAATDVDDWARAEATPSDEEIARIRRLINRIKGDLDQLTATERAEVEQAVATVRRHRTVMLGTPRVRQPLPDIHPERSA
jgi:integrase